MSSLLDFLPDDEGRRIIVMAGDQIGQKGTIIRRTKSYNYLVIWDDTGLMGEAPVSDIDFYVDEKQDHYVSEWK